MLMRAELDSLLTGRTHEIGPITKPYHALAGTSAALTGSLGIRSASADAGADAGADADADASAKQAYSAETTRFAWDDDVGMLLMRGYNSISGQMVGPVSDDCVESYSHTWIDEGSVKMDQAYSETKTQLAASLDLNLQASFGVGAFAASDSAKLAASTKLDRLTSVHSVRVYYNGPVLQTYLVKFKDKYLNMTYSDFVERCGDMYLSGVATGATLRLVFTINAVDMDSKLKLEASMQEKFATAFKAKESWAASLAAVMSSKEVTFQAFVNGGSQCDLPVVFSVDDVPAAVAKFTDSLKNCVGKVSNTDDTTTDYRSPWQALFTSNYAMWQAQKQDKDTLLTQTTAFRAIATDLETNEWVQDEIAAIATYAGLYDWATTQETPATIAAMKIEVDTNETAITGALNTCVGVPVKCSYDRTTAKVTDPNKFKDRLPNLLGHRPKDCHDLSLELPAADRKDGEYPLYWGSDEAKAYTAMCTDMATTNAKTFLKLKNVDALGSLRRPTYNYASHYVNYGSRPEWGAGMVYRVWNYLPISYLSPTAAEVIPMAQVGPTIAQYATDGTMSICRPGQVPSKDSRCFPGDSPNPSFNTDIGNVRGGWGAGTLTANLDVTGTGFEIDDQMTWQMIPTAPKSKVAKFTPPSTPPSGPWLSATMTAEGVEAEYSQAYQGLNRLFTQLKWVGSGP